MLLILTSSPDYGPSTEAIRPAGRGTARRGAPKPQSFQVRFHKDPCRCVWIPEVIPAVHPQVSVCFQPPPPPPASSDVDASLVDPNTVPGPGPKRDKYVVVVVLVLVLLVVLVLVLPLPLVLVLVLLLVLVALLILLALRYGTNIGPGVSRGQVRPMFTGDQQRLGLAKADAPPPPPPLGDGVNEPPPRRAGSIRQARRDTSSRMSQRSQKSASSSAVGSAAGVPPQIAHAVITIQRMWRGSNARTELETFRAESALRKSSGSVRGPQGPSR